MAKGKNVSRETERIASRNIAAVVTASREAVAVAAASSVGDKDVS